MTKAPSMFMKAAKVLCLCVGIFVCCLLNACKEEKPAPKYVFLFIGDGFSFAQRQIAEMARGEPLVSSGFPVQGVMTVSAADSFIPDSAAAASAFSTGKRIPNGNVAFIPESEGELDLITELAAKSGVNTKLPPRNQIDVLSKRHSDVLLKVIRLFVLIDAAKVRRFSGF